MGVSCPSARRGADATGRSSGGDGGSRDPSLWMCSSSWSPALPTHAAGLAGTEQQEKLTFTGARGLLWGYFWGVFVSPGEHQQREEEEELKPIGFHSDL